MQPRRFMKKDKQLLAVALLNSINGRLNSAKQIAHDKCLKGIHKNCG